MRIDSRRGRRVGVVGATGLVGRELLETLEKRRFPVGELLAFSSGRAGTAAAVLFRGKRLPAPAVSKTALCRCEIVFLVSSDAVARQYGLELAQKGIWVIDDSSAFRLDPRVPLVIPEVNATALRPTRRLIAGPNCTLTGAAVAGFPIVKACGAQSVHIASYQAVSGAGKAALREFLEQQLRLSQACRQGPERLSSKLNTLSSRALPRPIAMNVFPQVGSFDGRGNSSEETKVALEMKKIWGVPGLRVSVTAVRVPVLRGHSLSFWLETKKPITPARAKALLRKTSSVRLWPDDNYPTPHDAQETWPVHVGRVRAGTSAREICLWVVSDNLLKGAALNSVQIAEELLRRGWVQKTRE